MGSNPHGLPKGYPTHPAPKVGESYEGGVVIAAGEGHLDLCYPWWWIRVRMPSGAIRVVNGG